MITEMNGSDNFFWSFYSQEKGKSAPADPLSRLMGSGYMLSGVLYATLLDKDQE